MWMSKKERLRSKPGARRTGLEALEPHNLTLENLASIAAQQVGGFVGAGAHGTGACLPPVDEHVLAMTVATPGQGVVTKKRGDADFHAFSLLPRVVGRDFDVDSHDVFQETPTQGTDAGSDQEGSCPEARRAHTRQPPCEVHVDPLRRCVVSCPITRLVDGASARARVMNLGTTWTVACSPSGRC